MQRVALLLACLVAGCGGSDRQEDDAAKDFRQWDLPQSLREISGLALTPDQRLLAVNDEEAIVYELDYRHGRIVKTFSLGNPVLRGDFEGIAVLQDQVWLMTSDGDLYRFEEGGSGDTVAYEKVSTGHGDYCELEGLAQLPARSALLLVCKETHSQHDPLLAFEWTVVPDAVSFSRQIVLPGDAAADRVGERSVNPSAVAIDPLDGDWLLVAARQRALIRLTPGGDLADAVLLPRKGRHRQAEGLEVTRDGQLLVADEGGDGVARLAVYRVPPFHTDHD